MPSKPSTPAKTITLTLTQNFDKRVTSQPPASLMNSTSPCEKAHTYRATSYLEDVATSMEGRGTLSNKSLCINFNGLFCQCPAEKRMFSKTASMCEGPSSSEIATVLLNRLLDTVVLELVDHVIEKDEGVVAHQIRRRCTEQEHSNTTRIHLYPTVLAWLANSQSVRCFQRMHCSPTSSHCPK